MHACSFPVVPALPHCNRVRRLCPRVLVWFFVLAASLTGCAPDEIEGEVLREEWSEYECAAALRISSGDVVHVRFLFARKGRPGFDRTSLKAESLTGKHIRCVMGMAYKVERCTVIDSSGNRPLKVIGVR